MNKEQILSRLNKEDFYKNLVPSLKVNGKPEALGLCPLHDDHNPSLSVNLETGLFRCFSCDAKGDLFIFYQKFKDVDFPTALKEIGKMAGVAESDTKPKTVATFKYTDEAGNLLYTKERIEPGRNGRSKEFVFKHLVNGKWTLGRGCNPVLYNLPKLIKSKYAFIVEGEGKVDLMDSWGLTATCLDSGANSPIRDEYVQILGSIEKIIVLPDADTPGRNYACKIANSLLGKVKELKVVEIPGLKESEDVIDWARNAGNKEKLMEIVKNTSLWTSKECNETAGFDITKALKIGAELQTLDIPVKWAVKGLIPKEAITLLSARGGMGKTILSISVADAVTKGIPFLGLATTKTQVVYIDFENSLPTLIERIKRIDASNVLFWHPTNEIKPPRLDSKEYELYKKLPEGSLLVFDTLRASQSRDENDSQHMAMIMQRLKELRDCGYTILILHHTSKSSDRVYKGSTAIFDLCDHNLSLHKVKKGCSTPESEDDEDTDNYCYRLGTQDKTTRYEPFHIFLEFDIEKGCFVIAPDPETETLEEIHSLLVGKELLKTNDIFELVKGEIGIKSKGKLTYLLRKGIGKYWNSESRGRGKPTYYKATSPAVPLYIPRPLDYPAATSPDQKDQLPQKRLESPDFTDQSSSPAYTQTSWTGQEITSPGHTGKPRPVQTTSDDTKLVDLTNIETFEVETI
jgi:putative DNA primase/helicase